MGYKRNDILREQKRKRKRCRRRDSHRSVDVNQSLSLLSSSFPAHMHPWSCARDIIHALNVVARKRVLVSRALAPASANGAETAE
jgi:hypothetical protein